MATMNPHITERRRNPERRSGADQSMARRMGAFDWLAMVLMIIGGINWGLVGLMNIDLVAAIFGDGTTAARVVYALVGLAALYSIYTMSQRQPALGDCMAAEHLWRLAHRTLSKNSAERARQPWTLPGSFQQTQAVQGFFRRLLRRQTWKKSRT
jgi:uncharacterized membrane protein YuzA (DUF378 family)